MLARVDGVEREEVANMVTTIEWTTAAQVFANPRYAVRPATAPHICGMTLAPTGLLRPRGELRPEVGLPGGTSFEQGQIQALGRMNHIASPVTKSDDVRFATPPVPGTRSRRPPV